MEDPSVLPDLRAVNTGHASKFNTFWEVCKKFLNEDVGVAVDDRHHGEITHLAKPSRPKAPACSSPRGVWGHAPPEKF